MKYLMGVDEGTTGCKAILSGLPGPKKTLFSKLIFLRGST
jgi:sugar (pentulose or hexulose) kinase